MLHMCTKGAIICACIYLGMCVSVRVSTLRLCLNYEVLT